MDSWSFVTCYFSCGAKRGKFWAHPRGQPKRTQKVWEGHLGPYLGGDMGSIVEHVNLQGSNWQNMAKLICILSTNTSFAENVQNEGKNVIPRSQDWMFNPFWLAQLETHSKKNILANHAWKMLQPGSWETPKKTWRINPSSWAQLSVLPFFVPSCTSKCVSAYCIVCQSLASNPMPPIYTWLWSPVAKCVS
jgi:hypothetical protein